MDLDLEVPMCVIGSRFGIVSAIALQSLSVGSYNSSDDMTSLRFLHLIRAFSAVPSISPRTFTQIGSVSFCLALD